MQKIIIAFIGILFLITLSAGEKTGVFQITGAGKKNAEYLTDAGMVLYHIQKKNDAEVRELILKILEQNPRSTYYSLLAAEMLRKGNLAEKQFLEIVKRHPESAVLNNVAAVVLLEKEKTAAAEEVLSGAVSFRLAPREGDLPPRGISEDKDLKMVQSLYTLYLSLLFDKNDYDKADTVLQRIEKFSPMDFCSDNYLFSVLEFYFRLKHHKKDGDYQPFIRKYCTLLKERLAGENSFRESVPLSLLHFLLQENELDLAEALSTEILLTDFDHPAVSRNLKQWYWSQRDFRNVLRCDNLSYFQNLRRHRKVPREQLLLRMDLGVLLQDRALIRLTGKPLLEQNALPDELLYSVVELFLSGNNLRDAQMYLRAIKNPAMKDILQAYIFKQQKKYRESMKIFLKLERMMPETVLYKFMAAETAALAGEKEIEQQFLNEMLLKAEGSPEFQNYLSYKWAEKGVNLGQAEKFIRAALEKDPENYAYRDTLAWVLYRKKEYRKAETEILKALELCREGFFSSGVLLDHAGDIYHALGDLEKAKTYWQKAVQSNDLELDVQQVMKKLPEPVLIREITEDQIPAVKEDDQKTALPAP